MSSTPIHRLRARVSPVEHLQPRRAPIERLARSAEFLGTPTHLLETDTTAAVGALTGLQAAQQYTHRSAIPPQAHIDAYT